jgi:hypothetical protein
MWNGCCGKENRTAKESRVWLMKGMAGSYIFD